MSSHMLVVLRSDAVALVDAIRPCLIKNFAGIMNYTLYTRSHCGTKVGHRFMACANGGAGGGEHTH